MARNSVTVADTTNSGIIANRVTVNASGKPKQIILPGSIATDLRRYNHIEYLIKRLAKFRQAGQSYGQHRHSQIHPGSVRKILENELGGLPKDQPVQDFNRIVGILKAKINATALGKNNIKKGVPNYHEFDEQGKG